MRSTLDAQMALQAELLETTEALEPHLAAWDALAVARGRPYCAPGWMLSWLRAVAAPDALLRACVVTEGGELVGIAPLWAQEREGGGRYGLLSENTASPVEPLCAGGRESEVAAAFGGLLAEATPPPREIQLKYAPAGSPWPRLLAEHVPGYSPPSIECTRVMALPKVRLDQPNMDAWLATRSRNFRQQLRRAWRRLEDAGAVLRSSSGEEMDAGIEALSRLHHARWEARGGSRALNPRVEEMLRLAARELGEERLRLFSLEVDGASISAHLFVRAGGTCAYWLGGFDDRWAACRPSVQVLAAALEAAIESGDEWFELGPGAQPYKYRFADSEESVEWLTLHPAGG
jgi:CelD/BcsL family acetyltransferase involved in cellulose biosynthesis